MKYRTLEKLIASLLSDYPDNTEFEIVAHVLWGNSREGFECNSSWYLARRANKAECLTVARGRWEVFKANYIPRARVRDIEDIGYDLEHGCSLECQHAPFLDIRPA
jgi:hypothetical protein